MDEELKALLAKANENLDLYKKRLEAVEAKSKETETTLKSELDEKAKSYNEKIEELKNIIGDLEVKLEKGTTIVPQLQTKEHREQVRLAVKSGIAKFLKAGNDVKHGKTKGEELGYFITQETKALNLTNAGEGAEMVAEVLSMEIIERAREAYPILGEIRVRNMPRDLREEVLISYPSVQSGIENVAGANISETDTQTYVEVKNKVAKVNAKPRITDEALYGSDLDVYAHLLTLLDDEVGRWLVAQVLFGDGSGKSMRGILSSNRLDLTDTTGQAWKPTIGDGARSPDHFPALGTGVSANLPVTDVAIVDWLIDIETMLPSVYLQTAKYYMNRRTLARLRKVRDADENPIFTRDYIDGKNVMQINGYPVVIDDTMPDYGAANAPFLIFGDLSKAFSISPGDIDKMILDPYTVDGCLVVKMDKEYFEIIGKNDAIVIGAATTNDGVA